MLNNMEKIYIVYDGVSKEEDLQATGLATYISWESLKGYIAQAVHLKPNETIKGISIDKQNGIRVALTRKPR